MEFDPVGILFRWMHIFAAIALFGGMIYQRLALVPAVTALPEERRQELFESARRPWSRVVMLSILFLLVSGFANFFLTHQQFKNVGHELPGYYHALWGIKVLMAFGIFFFASALAGRGAGTQKFRDQPAKWLTVSIILATLVVAISGILRSTHTAPNAAVSQPAQTTSPDG